MIQNPNLVRQIRETIYALKKDFGVSATVYKLAAAETDYETGEKTATWTSVEVRRCPVLPASAVRKFAQSVTYLKSSASFVTPAGQGWDQGTRGFILDARDLPIGYSFEIEDWIVYNGKRYDPKVIEELGAGLGYLVLAVELRGSRPEQDIRVNVVQDFGVTDEAEEEVV